MSKLVIMGTVLLCALMGAVGQIFFKLGSKTINLNIMSWILNWKLAIGITLYALSTVIFVAALKFNNLSITYPIVATSYIWVTLFSIFILGEAFPAYKWLGIIMILAGVAIVTR